MTFQLTLIAGDALPQQIMIDAAIDIGRDPHCDVRIMDDLASRFHARIEPHADGLLLTDNRSRNGTWLRGDRVDRAILADGDTVIIGRVSFLIANLTIAEGDTRICSDAGVALQVGTEAVPPPWQAGESNADMAAIHAVCRKLATTKNRRDRARLCIAAAAHLCAAERAAMVLGGAVLAASMADRLALRLAAGNEARLLTLGSQLHGQTIASEAVGSAISVPLANGHLVVARTLDAEPLHERDRGRLARLAAETAVYFEPDVAGVTAEIIGSSAVMQQLRKRIERLAASGATVLVSGESGTGKELVARALHRGSARSDGPFIPVNCAAVAPSLFEAELFGHEKGAFTGAETARKGRLRAAHTGTVFLDEVGELPLELQVKLLRVLQEGQVEPVGSHKPEAVDIRVVAATNKDLTAAVAAGEFREDLYYRLDVLRVHTPSLGERSEDIPELATHFLQLAAEESNRSVPELHADALSLLQQAAWPGNVRQLANVVARALALADSMIEPAHLELDPAGTSAEHQHSPDHFPSLAEVEAAHVRAALVRCDWNKTAAAKLLGVSRPTVLRKIAEYGLSPA